MVYLTKMQMLMSNMNNTQSENAKESLKENTNIDSIEEERVHKLNGNTEELIKNETEDKEQNTSKETSMLNVNIMKSKEYNS